jgi:hypothetical protein
MSGERRVPDPRLRSNRGNQTQRKPPASNGSVPPYRPTNVRMSVPQPSVPPSVPVPRPSAPQNDWLPERSPVPTSPAVDSLPRRARRRRTLRLPQLKFPTSLKFWAIATVLICTGLGGLSLALLFKLPSLPNCPSIFWPTASGSLRLYCGQLAANKKTVDDLLEAIKLVDGLPDDHPLRSQANQYIEEWSQDILDLADEAFHAGQLQGAIDIANRIPVDTSAHSLVEERIKSWQSIWTKAEDIYKKAEAAMAAQDLRQAFAIAVQLLYVDNKYWETTKYRELTDLIEVARVEGGKLSKAKALARRGGLSNLLSAIKLLDEIKSDSPARKEAERLIGEFGQKLLDLAESRLRRRDAQEAISIARQIPSRAGLQAEVQDFIDLALAQEQAWGGTVADLESAIIQAQRLERNRPLYGKAQQLISRWQLEIQDVGHLEMARRFAEAGTMDDLRAAIAQAQQVPRGNPRREEAQEAIGRWTAQIETYEDQPYLDQAEQLARNGDTASLQAAIDQASQIRRGRTLYGEARDRIRDWTAQIQRIQDQPLLDRARRLAEVGDLGGAIATADQISSGRALSGEAQAAAQQWRDQIEGGNRMQQAYQYAGVGTTAMLLTAIRTADQVPSSSSTRSEADRMIGIWSQEILRIAEEQSASDLAQAIATAETVPARTEAYAAAQLRIQFWRQQQGF